MTTFSISLFRHARDNAPQHSALSLRHLVDLVAPEHPPVRGDLHYPFVDEVRSIDHALDAFLTGQGPTPALGGWYLLISQAAEQVRDGGGTWDDQQAAAQLEAERLRRECGQRAKAQLPAWSPAQFRAGGRRRKADVEALSCIVQDFDDGTPINAALAPWQGVTALVATSWSHTPDHPKFRLVLPLAEPIPAARCGTGPGLGPMNAVAAALTGPAAMRPGFYFLPARPHGQAPYEVRHVLMDGPLLRVPQHTLRPPARPVRRPVPAPARPVALPARQALWLAKRRLQSSPEVRMRAGQYLGGTAKGEGAKRRIVGVICPRCRRPSAWWWIAAERQTRAWCSHRNTCGWTGGLIELLGGLPDV